MTPGIGPEVSSSVVEVIEALRAPILWERLVYCYLLAFALSIGEPAKAVQWLHVGECTPIAGSHCNLPVWFQLQSAMTLVENSCLIKRPEGIAVVGVAWLPLRCRHILTACVQI